MSTFEQTSAPAANAASSPDDLRIFVGYLPLSANAKVIKALLRDANVRAQVNVDRVTRVQRVQGRYAIVTFKSAEDKSKGLETLIKEFDDAPETPIKATASPDEAAQTSSETSSTPENGSAQPRKLYFGSAPSKPRAPKEKKAPADASGAETTGNGRSSKDAASAAAAETSASADASAPTSLGTNGNAEDEGASGASTSPAAAPKSKTSPRPKRAPAKFVPRPSAVYVTLPPHTEADEVRELLSGFPSVEIKLGHRRGRTVFRRGKRVDIPERTYAVVTVGEDHQQRAIEQLDGKVVREFRISAKPSSQRLLAEDAKEEARAARKADEAAPESQPNAEHAEHAEQVGAQSEPSA